MEEKFVDQADRWFQVVVGYRSLHVKYGARRLVVGLIGCATLGGKMSRHRSSLSRFYCAERMVCVFSPLFFPFLSFFSLSKWTRVGWKILGMNWWS